jgi:hypothetical protein
MKRPPPYFPQSSLSPADENRYKKFKIIVGTLAVLGLLVLVGVVIGAYYLFTWLFSG